LADKIDILTILVYVVIGSFLAVMFVFYPQIVYSPLLSVQILLDGLVVFVFAYPVFWALNIRRFLAVRLYKSQALGLALICVAFSLGSFDPTGAIYGLFLLLVFYWIDLSFRAARRSDPLLRDSIRWSRLRLVLWPVNLLQIPLSIYTVLAVFGYLPSAVTLGNTIEIAPFFATAASGVALAAVVALRTADGALRGQLIWFGIFVFVQFAIIIVAQVNSVNGAVYFVGFEFAAFALYKSARSLVPLNRILLD
jgi:hypothetical protein